MKLLGLRTVTTLTLMWATPAAAACHIGGLPQEVPGTSLVRFSNVAPGIYRGSRPQSLTDFLFLRKQHVKTILSLELWKWHHDDEAQSSHDFNIGFELAPIEGTAVQPSQESVETALAILRNKENWPIYIHCALGRDRTSLIVALYRVYDEKCSVDDARAEMRLFGLKENTYVLSGLNHYFDEHTQFIESSNIR